jgi:hypothetical protein
MVLIACLVVADLLLALGATIAFRGMAFAVFNFAGGIAMLAESVLAGGIWDAFGPLANFLAGFAMVGLIGPCSYRRRDQEIIPRRNRGLKEAENEGVVGNSWCVVSDARGANAADAGRQLRCAQI